MSTRTKGYILFAISVTAFLAIVVVGPLTQDPNYHTFADERLLYDVPNFWNVVTNLPFCVIGILGVLAVRVGRDLNLDQQSRPNNAYENLKCSCYVFFIGIFFTGIGSAYYHWNPVNETLVWDRLPLTIAFMGFFSFLIGNYISSRAGQQVLWPLVAIGLMSIVYWMFSGDLRLYVLVQFLPIVLMPLIILFYRSQFLNAKFIWGVMLCYMLAKICEGYDKQIFTGLELAGHSLKHLFAALAPVSLLMGVTKMPLARS